MPQKPQDIKLRFPAKGLVESQSFTTQPPGTTSAAMNVVAFDPSTGRARGGSRSGIDKFIKTSVSGGLPIQELNSIKYTLAGDTIIEETGGLAIATETSLGRLDFLMEDSTSNSDQQQALVAISNGFVRYHSLNTPTDYSVLVDYLPEALVLYLGVEYHCLLANGPGSSIKNPATEPTYWTSWRTLSGDAQLQKYGSAPQIFSEVFFEDLFICDGRSYKIADIGSGTLSDWTSEDGQLPFDSQGVETEWTADVTFAIGDMAMYEGNLYIALASTRDDEPSTSPSDWAVIPGLDRCRLMAVCFGRMILSGLRSDPTNWFMSAVEDPYNWRYDPDTPTVQQAVAGTTADCGLSGDIITALIPFTDDVLIIGGNTTIERLSGDPADGGRRDRITATTGIAWGKAWCQSPDGTIYFVGSRGGVYQLHPSGSEPTRLTAFTIDELTQDWDTNTNIFRLVWDDRAIAVHVFVTPKGERTDDGDPSETTHYTYDVRNQSWWPFEYLNDNYNPTTLHLLTANTSPENRAVLIGSFDGYVRWLNWDATMDDEVAIRSEVNLAQFTNQTIVSLQGVLGKSSGHVTWKLMNGDTFDDGIEGLIVDHGSWKSGFNSTRWCRRYLDYGYLRLSSSEPWQMEEIAVTIQDGGRTRDRMV